MTSLRPAKRLSLSVVGSVALLATAVALSACAPAGEASTPPHGSGGAGESALKVVTTTTVFADIVRNVGGDRITVSSIIPPGSGPEDYEPKPADAQKLADADLVVSNGVGLDDFLDRLVQAAGEGQVPRLVLGDGIPTITVDGEPNPHFWLDPSLVADHYLPAIIAELSELDPAGAPAFTANGAAYAVKVKAMDDANKARIATIPAENRKLVTFHDAYPYFARHYGFELIGVIVANVGQEPTAADLATLVQTVKAAHVNAVFSESQFSPKLAETLAAEAGVQHVVTTLYNDTLGPAPADTYLGMMAFDVEEIAKVLS